MRRRLLLLAGLAFVVWAAVAAIWLVRIASDLKAGNDAASAARDQLGAEQVADQEPLPELRVAQQRFASAHDRVGGAVLMPMRFLPVIGRQLRSIDALSGAAEEVAATGVDAIVRAGVVFDDPAAAGADRVDQVRELSAVIDDVVVRLEAVDDFGPIKGLLAPLADARNELAADLAEARGSLREARTGAQAALSLVTGPRRYLVLAANNAEMRAGSGMWLQGGALVTSNGDLELEDMVSLHLDADPPVGAAAPTDALSEHWSFLNPGNEWRNLMASPSFPESAELATRMWAAAGRGEVDGVIAVDAIGLQAIIEATGPVQVGDETLEADDVPQQILHDQYLEFDDLGSLTGGDIERRESLATLAQAAVAAIDEGDYPASTLIRTLGDAIAGRHLLAWSTDEVEQQGWDAAGMNGVLDADSLLVSVLNRGGNKLDWFLDVDAALSFDRGSGGTDVTVELTLRNDTPDAGEPTYVQGPHPGLDLDPGEYRGILAVNVPGAAQESHFEGVDSLAVAGRDGATRVVGFQLDLPRGETRVVVLRFRLPSQVDELSVVPSARVPGITWHYGSSDWEDSAARTANW